jgi:hypothetical protein
MLKQLFEEAVKLVICPRCGEVINKCCRTPSGGKTDYTHLERVVALSDLPGFNLAEYNENEIQLNFIKTKVKHGNVKSNHSSGEGGKVGSP